MELHEFLLPQIVGNPPSFEEIEGKSQPFNVFVGVNRQEDQLFLNGAIFNLSDQESWESELSSGGNGHRKKVVFEPPFSQVTSTVYVDLEDARYIPREFLYGRDFNVFQYNRRRGDRTSILWSLASYFVPDESLGHRPKVDFSNEPSFEDKIPKVFWRGGVSGSQWSSPLRRQGPGKINLRTIVNPNLWTSNSRFNLVFGKADSPLIDAKFSGNTVERFVQSHLQHEDFFGSAVSPSEMVKYRYLLCPAGNDVASSLYWIIGTKSIAVKEDVEYEVWPDYFLKPWVHYIPVSKGLSDLEDKIAFCEDNPGIAKQIIENANEAYWLIRDEQNWRYQSSKVLERLNLL